MMIDDKAQALEHDGRLIAGLHDVSEGAWCGGGRPDRGVAGGHHRARSKTAIAKDYRPDVICNVIALRTVGEEKSMFHTHVLTVANRPDGGKKAVDFDRASFLMDKDLLKQSIEAMEHERDYNPRHDASYGAQWVLDYYCYRAVTQQRSERAVFYDQVGRKAQARRELELIYAEGPGFEDARARLGLEE
jgi:hypothetical protein